MSRAGVVLGVLATGVVAGTLGVLAGRALAQNEPKKTPLPAPPPAQTNALLQPVTTDSQVRPFQTIIAEALSKRPKDMEEWGILPRDYGVGDVDGNPNNPKWMRMLSLLQKQLNVFLTEEGVPHDAPPGFPPQLRTDGVLDYATATAIFHL